MHNVFPAREEGREFDTLFGRLKDERNKFVRLIGMIASNFEVLKYLLSTDNQKNTR